MVERISRGALRQQLVDSLTERELAGLVKLLSKKCRPIGAGSPHKSYVMGFDAKTVFGILHQEMSGRWRADFSASQDIMGNIEEVKRTLARMCPADPPVLPPQMPQGFCISNAEAGRAEVTGHAWEQFCRRFYNGGNNLIAGHIAGVLSRAFARATRANLPRGWEARRTIKHDFTPAAYYLDVSLNCRFVVVSENGRTVLLTVERPYPSR